jgi:hypothetical protein
LKASERSVTTGRWKSLSRGLQVYGFEWRKCLSEENLGRLDYVAADALIFPDTNGRNVMLWRHLRVLAQRIQVWANPTYIPESLKARTGRGHLPVAVRA